MKYLLILAIVMVVLWLWKNNRRTDINNGGEKTASPRPKPPGVATEIVACDVCHVHLPRSEALTGPRGVYCCVAHRQQAGSQGHP